ncbi:MAG: preprotein translocase subunit YajC [Phycisphaeraceae bacterium]
MDQQPLVTYTLAQADDPAPFTPEMQNGAANQTGEGQVGEGQTGEGQAGAAQDSNAQNTGNGGAGGTGGGGFDPMFLILMVGLLVVMMIFFSTSQRREKKKRQAMLDALKKGDRVQSVGGIIGSVVDIRDDEIVVKVDENTNTRLRFARNAVQTVLNKDE